jgi:hypothetical protein
MLALHIYRVKKDRQHILAMFTPGNIKQKNHGHLSVSIQMMTEDRKDNGLDIKNFRVLSHYF